MYSGQWAKALFSIMLLPRRTWSFPSSGWLHVCAEQCHCLQINRPQSLPCAVRRAEWAGLTSCCTSQVFRLPFFPLLEVLLRLFSLPSVSREVTFKSCLNSAGLAGRDAALAHCPARPAGLCPQSALPMKVVGGCPWQREDWCIHRITGLPAADASADPRATIQLAGKSQPALVRAAAPLEAPLAWRAGTHARTASGEQHLHHQRSAPTRDPSSGARRQLITCVWQRTLL